jgi:hypothetical protein
MNRGGSLEGTKVWRAALTLVVLTVLFAAVGCGGDDDDDAEAAGTTAAETTETTGTTGEPSGEPIVIGAAIAQTGIIAPFDGPALNGATLAAGLSRSSSRTRSRTSTREPGPASR